MKKFEMPKFEMVGLSADLAFAGNSGKGGSFEFATPKTTFSVSNGNKFTTAQILSTIGATADELASVNSAS